MCADSPLPHLRPRVNVSARGAGLSLPCLPAGPSGPVVSSTPEALNKHVSVGSTQPPYPSTFLYAAVRTIESPNLLETIPFLRPVIELSGLNQRLLRKLTGAQGCIPATSDSSISLEGLAPQPKALTQAVPVSGNSPCTVCPAVTPPASAQLSLPLRSTQNDTDHILL